MKLSLTQVTAVVAMFITLCVYSSTGYSIENDEAQSKVQSFLKSVSQTATIDAGKKKEVDATVNEFLEDSASEAMTEGLLVLYPDYATAIDADDVATSTELLMPLTESSDPFLAADASFYLARTLMNDENFETALPILHRLAGDLADHSVHSGNVGFFIGVAQAGLLRNHEAIQSFAQFLELHPDAPERLRVSAWRQVQQLQKIKKGQMTDVYQRMDFSRRRLQLNEPDDATQEQQDNVVKMLAKLIKEQEKKECSGSKSNSKNTKKQQQKKQQNKQQQSKQKPGKKSSKGSKSNVANGRAVQKTYNGPSSPWSRLRDRSRDPANSAIKEKLPSRYRDIVERYYEAANGNKK